MSDEYGYEYEDDDEYINPNESQEDDMDEPDYDEAEKEEIARERWADVDLRVMLQEKAERKAKGLEE